MVEGYRSSSTVKPKSTSVVTSMDLSTKSFHRHRSNSFGIQRRTHRSPVAHFMPSAHHNARSHPDPSLTDQSHHLDCKTLPSPPASTPLHAITDALLNSAPPIPSCSTPSEPLPPDQEGTHQRRTPSPLRVNTSQTIQTHQASQVEEEEASASELAPTGSPS